MSPALNENSALQHFERNNVVKIQNRIVFNSIRDCLCALLVFLVFTSQLIHHRKSVIQSHWDQWEIILFVYKVEKLVRLQFFLHLFKFCQYFEHFPATTTM